MDFFLKKSFHLSVDTEGCADWLSYCEGETEEAPYMSDLNPDVDLADPKLGCEVRGIRPP